MLNIFTVNESEKWDEIVKSFKNYDVYYLSGYVKAFQLHGDGEPLLFYFEDGETRAINVVMKRDISEDKHFINKIELNKYYDLSTPYGYGGWLIEGDNIELLDKKYSEYCKDNNIVSEFVRFNPYINNITMLNDIYEVRKLGKVVSIDTSDKDIIWTNISSRTRTKINKTKKFGVEIKFSKNIGDIDTFLKLYNKAMDRNEATEYYYFSKEYFYKLLCGLKENFLIIKAIYNDILVASTIMIFGNGMMSYHLGGSSILDKNINPVCLSFYEVANWCNDNNIKLFILGGGVGGQEDSLYRFKKAFNKNGDMDFNIGRKIFNQQKYDELLKMRKQSNGDFDKSSKYFPLYRS